MHGVSNIEDKFIKWREEAEKLSEARCDGDSKHGIPDKKPNDGMLGNDAFFPSDSGVRKISDNGSDSSGDKIGKPDEIVVLNDKVRKNGKKSVVEASD